MLLQLQYWVLLYSSDVLRGGGGLCKHMLREPWPGSQLVQWKGGQLIGFA